MASGVKQNILQTAISDAITYNTSKVTGTCVMRVYGKVARIRMEFTPINSVSKYDKIGEFNYNKYGIIPGGRVIAPVVNNDTAEIIGTVWFNMTSAGIIYYGPTTSSMLIVDCCAILAD